jgi:cell division protein FtsI/penicillin-binding protein 2
MTRRGMVHAAVWIVLALLLWSRQRYEPLSYYSSKSYVQRANDLIRKGGLKFDCRTDRIELTERATAAERKWFGASYLQNDVELYNRNRELFGHFFVVQDCELRELNPYLRTIRLPFAKSIDWLGSIDYSGPGSDATLVSSNGRTIHIQRTLPTLPQREVRTPVGAKNDVAANLVHLDFGTPATPGVEVHSAAGTAILEQRVKRGQAAEVRLLGNAVGEGRIAKMLSGDWLHLASGARSETFLYTGERRYESLSIVRTRNARRERTYAEEEPLLRWIGGEDGEEMVSFGEALARSVTNAVQQLDATRAKELAAQFDVQLSIDRALQTSLNETLAAYATTLVRDAAGGEPFAASVTVMNGRSGEILAAASFPSQADLDDVRGVSEEERRRLLVNHNFKRHPIGSAGKPFLYAAVATRHPFLLDMTVAPHGPAERADGGKGEREVLQFFFPRDYLLWPHLDERIGLESAIERSCNKFTVELATLALAAPRDLTERRLSNPLSEVFARQRDVVWTPAANDAIQIAGQTLDFPPSLGMFMNEDAKPIPAPEVGKTTAAILPGPLNRIDEAPFIETFQEITGVRTYGGLAAPDVPAGNETSVSRGAMVTMQYDLRPWRPLVERFTQGESSDRAWKLRAAFQAVSPERVNLSLNQVNLFREEFVSLLLGGASSMWTNVQLAEAASRLVMKRQVEATMVHTLRDRVRQAQDAATQPPAFADLGVSDEARAAVLRGMRRVTLPPHGTARDFGLEAVLDRIRAQHPGYHVALFSKTGSPTVTRREAKPIGEILKQLVTRGHVSLQGGRIVVSPDRQAIVAYAAPRAPGRAAYLAALTRATSTAATRTGQPHAPRTTQRVAAYIDRFARYRSRPRSEEVRLPFTVVNDVLVLDRDHPAFQMSEETDAAALYLLTLVKWKGTPDVPTPADLQHPDARVITAVFYFDIGPGSPVAVEGARAMLGRIGRLLE